MRELFKSVARGPQGLEEIWLGWLELVDQWLIEILGEDHLSLARFRKLASELAG